MSSKYQIFISSTFGDLQEERSLIIKAILEMGHIPVGMEMFSAADDEQWNIIARQIDASDYYAVIVAHRYGSTLPDGTSYTEREYDYAVSKGVPVLGFVLDDSVEWPKSKSDSNKIAISRLQAFKGKIKTKLVSYWKGGDDLYGRCAIALMKAFTAYPREGWVRASGAQDAASSKELARLSAENASLRKAMEVVEAERGVYKEFSKITNIFVKNKRKISVFLKNATGWSPGGEYDLFTIFENLAPSIRHKSKLVDISIIFAMLICRKDRQDLREPWPAPVNIIRQILSEFAAYDLIEYLPGNDNGDNSATETCTLSARGADYLAYIKRWRMEQGAAEWDAKVQVGGVGASSGAAAQAEESEAG